jgi:hypothetical protein
MAFRRLILLIASLIAVFRLAGSYRLNEQWASDYVRRGREKVREMMKDTSSMMSRYAQKMRTSSLAGFICKAAGMDSCAAGRERQKGSKRVAGAFSVDPAAGGCEAPPGAEFGW